MSFCYLGFKDKIITFRYNQLEIINPYEVALQAMLGEEVNIVYKNNEQTNLIPRYYPINQLPDVTENKYAIAGIEWLIKNACIKGRGCYWKYNYAISYNNEYIQSGWKSSFAQAYGILAFIYWYKMTNQTKYLKLAEKSANTLVSLQKEGGTLYNHNEWFWFEEVPNQQPTHILNAHLISIVALQEFIKLVDKDDYRKYIDKAISSLKYNLFKFDSGVYSNYEISRYINKTIQIKAEDYGRKIYISRIKFFQHGKMVEELDVCDIRAFDNRKDIYISGIDWGIADEGYRELLPGELIHPIKVEGGERQNTYICFKDFYLSDYTLKIQIEYKSEWDNKIIFSTYDSEGNMIQMDNGCEMIIIASKNTSQLYLDRRFLSDALSEVYHRYHILLLEEIYKVKDDRYIKNYINRFREYSKKTEKSNCNIERKLQTLYVAMSKEDELHCKMHNIEEQDKVVTIYKKLLDKVDNSEFPIERFLLECEEFKDELEVIHFIGIEPMLYKELNDLIRKVKKLGIKVKATINGIILNRVLDQLLETELDELWIRIDGLYEVHNEIKSKEGLLENITQAVKEKGDKINNQRERYGFKLNVSCVINPMNYMYLVKLVEMLAGEGIDNVSFTHMGFDEPWIEKKHNTQCIYCIGEFCNQEMMLPKNVNPYAMWRELHKLENMSTRIGINLVPKLKDYLDCYDLYHQSDISIDRRQRDFMNSFIVDYDGNISVVNRCHSALLGNIKNKSLREIIYSSELERFIQYIRENEAFQICK